jgi:hypothetical protein
MEFLETGFAVIVISPLLIVGLTSENTTFCKKAGLSFTSIVTLLENCERRGYGKFS